MRNSKKNASIENISIFGIKENISALALFVYAESFLKSANSVTKIKTFDPSRYYLVCHSIELYLKAFLSLDGNTMISMADEHGHNLDKLIVKSLENKLEKTANLNKSHTDEIKKASDYYSGKVFEYPAVGEAIKSYPNIPNIDVLFEACEILSKSLKSKCETHK